MNDTPKPRKPNAAVSPEAVIAGHAAAVDKTISKGVIERTVVVEGESHTMILTAGTEKVF